MQLGFWTPLPHVVGLEAGLAGRPSDSWSSKLDSAAVDRPYELAVEVAQIAEAAGFTTTLVAERFIGQDLEAWILSTALAVRTRSLELMTAVHPGIISPLVVAKMGATLDRISGGRFAVNIVNGWWKEEFDLFSHGGWIEGFEDRYLRMDEFIQVIKGLWTQDAFSFDGKFYKFGPFDIQSRPTRVPPIYAASRSEEGQDIIARHCDVWFTTYDPDHRLYEANMERLSKAVSDMKARTARYDRSVRCGIQANVVCTPTVEEAKAEVERLEAFGKQGRLSMITSHGLGAGLIGTPEVVAERIRRYKSIGIDLLMLKFVPMLAGLRNFSTEVVPLLSDVLDMEAAQKEPA